MKIGQKKMYESVSGESPGQVLVNMPRSRAVRLNVEKGNFF